MASFLDLPDEILLQIWACFSSTLDDDDIIYTRGQSYYEWHVHVCLAASGYSYRQNDLYSTLSTCRRFAATVRPFLYRNTVVVKAGGDDRRLWSLLTNCSPCRPAMANITSLIVTNQDPWAIDRGWEYAINSLLKLPNLTALTLESWMAEAPLRKGQGQILGLIKLRLMNCFASPRAL